jgi:hypothetical protein
LACKNRSYFRFSRVLYSMKMHRLGRDLRSGTREFIYPRMLTTGVRPS